MGEGRRLWRSTLAMTPPLPSEAWGTVRTPSRCLKSFSSASCLFRSASTSVTDVSLEPFFRYQAVRQWKSVSLCIYIYPTIGISCDIITCQKEAEKERHDVIPEMIYRAGAATRSMFLKLVREKTEK